ncbi:hypothetical protein GH714_029907 [Hevea brasiliensis]|uniref:Myb-like domain-containing protein n=1 Tax=Hevea brasiliensis TaxID=3981 RepID=A0A6A6M1R3_HEVBR|nr:hypothetical protein GH714_029907 [Hevea brasiliensis]
MEMEDQNHHNQYSIDLRQFISGRPTHFPAIPQPPSAELFSAHRNLPPQAHHYDMMMLMSRGGGLHDFHSDSTTASCVLPPPPPPPPAPPAAAAANSGNTSVAAASATPTLSGLEAEVGSFGGDGGTGRWPRQETLTLLEIRSRLDSKFKEANQKGPLWDEMRKLIERQEAWLEKLTKTMEQKEQERTFREEEWRNKKLPGRETNASSPEELMRAHEIQNQRENGIENGSERAQCDSWTEAEVTRLMQLRSNMGSRFQQNGCMEEEEALWEDISAKMACMGYERSALMCKEKWDSINNYTRKTKEGSNKKRKENSRGCCYFQNNESIYNPGGDYCEINEQGPETVRLQANEGCSPANSNAGNAVSDSCFRYLMGDGGENLWENYGLKLSKGDQN